MSKDPVRRAFLKQVSASVAALSGFDASWLLEEKADPTWANLPRLDGTLLFDEASREQVATDLGAHFHRRPAVVLKPRSVADVVKLVRFANTRRLPIAARGQGHSQYGQTLVEGGIVIDSSALNVVKLGGARSVDAQAGASWNDVTRATLAQQLTPPAMGNTMTLSVGGILSAGGVSNSSHLYGAIVDNVEELDVVTGAGELVTCTPRRHSDLFELALGGMGQCGLIVSARMRLVPAPSYVARREFFYDDLTPFLADAARIVREAKVEHLGAHVLPVQQHGRWRFRIEVGKFCASPDEVDLRPLEADLRFASREQPAPVSYMDYLQREAASNAGVAAARRRTPFRLHFITMFVPGPASEEFLARILATPHETAGVARFTTQPLNTRKFARPFLVLPQDEHVLSLWMMFRGIPLADAARHAQRVESNRGMIERMREAGGKAYPPYAPFYGPSDWEAHYGTRKWRRLVAAKKKFDPAGILTPGVGVFASAAQSGRTS